MPERLLKGVLDHADVEAPVGRGCVVLRLSRRRLRDAEVRRTLGRQADRAGRIAVICNSADGAIVTVLHDQGACGRRYRGRA